MCAFQRTDFSKLLHTEEVTKTKVLVFIYLEGLNVGCTFLSGKTECVL